MSDNEGGKKSGYRLEYASSGRSKCNGESNIRALPHPRLTTLPLAFHASLSRPRPQAVRLCVPLFCLIFPHVRLDARARPLERANSALAPWLISVATPTCEWLPFALYFLPGTRTLLYAPRFVHDLSESAVVVGRVVRIPELT